MPEKKCEIKGKTDVMQKLKCTLEKHRQEKQREATKKQQRYQESVFGQKKEIVTTLQRLFSSTKDGCGRVWGFHETDWHRAYDAWLTVTSEVT